MIESRMVLLHLIELIQYFSTLRYFSKLNPIFMILVSWAGKMIENRSINCPIFMEPIII